MNNKVKVKVKRKEENPKPSKELLRALKEGEKIEKEIASGKIKGYSNMEDFIKSLEN